MLDRIDGMIPHHAGTGKAHHSTHPFPHVFFIAMHRTLPASLLRFSKLASVQSGMGILKQGTTFRTKLTVTFLQPAIQPYHLLHRFLFFRYSSHGRVFCLQNYEKIGLVLAEGFSFSFCPHKRKRNKKKKRRLRSGAKKSSYFFVSLNNPSLNEKNSLRSNSFSFLTENTRFFFTLLH